MKRFLSGLGRWMMWLAFIVGIFLIFVGGAKIALWLEPWVRFFSALTILLALPIALVLLVFPKTRGWGCVGIYLVSWPMGLWVWLASLIYAVSVSVFWAVVGVFMGGIGIVPIALIMMLLRRDWGNFGVIIATVAVVLLLQWPRSRIMEKTAERDSARLRAKALKEVADAKTET